MDKGWLLMFFGFLIFKKYIPTVINDGSTTQQKLFDALKNFRERFDQEKREVLEKKFG
jgi:hypothetical protein